MLDVRAECLDWSEAVPAGADPLQALVPYWQVLCEIIDPIREDALFALDWQQVKFALDQEPVPPEGFTFIWNMRWRKVVCLCWDAVERYEHRRLRRRLR